MPAFKVDIALGNDGMQTAEDVAKALEKIADRVRNYTGLTNETHLVQDANGNAVGTFWGMLIEEGQQPEASLVDLDNWVPGEDADADSLILGELTYQRAFTGDTLSEVDLDTWEPGEDVDADSLVENEVQEFRQRRGIAVSGALKPIRHTVDRIKLNDQLTPIWNEAGLGDEDHDEALNDLTHEVADRIERELSGD